MTHVSDNNILRHGTEQFPGIGADLRSIPVWPSFNTSQEEFICADVAFTTAYPELLVPWTKSRTRFIDPLFMEIPQHRICLSGLGIKDFSALVVLRDYVLPMPQSLDAAQLKQFVPLVSTIAQLIDSYYVDEDLLLFLQRNKFAADRNCVMRKASELCDHGDPIFVAAFRHSSKQRFLHPTLEHHRSLWLKLGLHHRANNLIDAGDYIQCLRVLSDRLSATPVQNDPELEQDCQTILSPLLAPNISTQRFNAGDWQAISQEHVFKPRTDLSAEPEYRRGIMAKFAAKKALPLADVVLYKHAARCWSQTPFVAHQPTQEVLSRVSGHGAPQIEMVWLHLQYMSTLWDNLKQDQVRDFLADLDRTYQYLQDHLPQSRTSYALQNSAVWLNLETIDHSQVLLDEICSSWQGIQNLLLSSSYDSGQMKAVRPSLMRFEKLLRALDCRSIAYPTVTSSTQQTGSSISDSLRQLRKEEELLDVTFSTEGKLIRAHKVVLAAMSKVCARHFKYDWGKSDVITFDDKDDDAYMSYHTLSTMVGFIYEETIDWAEMEVSEADDEEKRETKLDLLLNLHQAADYYEISALASQVERKILIGAKLLVNVGNVRECRDRAEEVQALDFMRWCDKLIEDNPDIVERAYA